jgi:hypothetical protein
MVRAGLLLAMLTGAAPALAGPFADELSPLHRTTPDSPLAHPLDLSAFDARRSAARAASHDEFSPGAAQSQSQWAQPLAIPGLSIGMAGSDPGGRAGKRQQFPIVRLQGVTIFGGSVGGRVDGRSAHLVLSWHTN